MTLPHQGGGEKRFPFIALIGKDTTSRYAHLDLFWPMRGFSCLKRKEGGGGSDYDWGYDYRLLKKPRYFTKQGTVAKDPTLVGAPELTVLADGPPERLP